MSFSHLHLHTTYSIGDSITQIGPLFNKIKNINQTAVALTDHGNMFGSVVFYKKAKEMGIKPIIGCEVYMAHSRMGDKQGSKGTRGYGHLILLAQNSEGYKNLIKLCSLGYTEGFYYKPRIDKEVLSEYKNGLICLTACLAGTIQQHIVNNRIEQAIKELEWYQTTFKDNFYLEIQNHHIKEEGLVRNFFKDMSSKYSIPIVATNDSHYIEKEDAESHDIMLCIGTNKKRDDQDRRKYNGYSYHVTTEEEMFQLFPDFPDSIGRTQEVVDKINFEMDFKTHHFPKYDVPVEYTLDSYLEKKVYNGANKRFNNNITQEIRDRIDLELSVIKKCGFSEYFLLVYDFVNWAKEKNIAVGPGRGSGAGSMVVYCLFITDVDPLQYGLFFERFLNPERVSMPDIDIDFCYFRRQEVIDYVVNKYGKENVSNIITFSFLGAKSVINAVAKVLGISFQDSQKLSKSILLPTDSLDNNLQANPELKSIFEENDLNRELLKISKTLEGCIKHSGIHASGIVVTSGNIDSYVPVMVDKDNQLATQYDMESVDATGMLKVDFLGLRTMTVINETIRLVKERRGIDLVINKLPLADPEVYKSLAKGETSGVFQLESHGMRKLLDRMAFKDNNFRDLIALVALYRPGPIQSGMVDKFIDRKNGIESVTYIHDSMKEILQETYGVIVYQEQIMQIAVKLCGFTMGRGDVLRKAMGKKKKDVMDAMREEFVNGGMKTSGLSYDIMTQLFDDIEKFAAYGFNKSHSLCYALLAYVTAYLKVHYTVEFMASLLTSVVDKEVKVQEYFVETKRLGIPILLPDINESYKGFEVTNNGEIRYGMGAIRNVGDVALENILTDRKDNGYYVTLENFCSRVKVSKKIVENLIKCGSFDKIANRPQLMAIASNAIDIGKKIISEKDEVSLLDFDDEYDNLKDIQVTLPNIPDWNDEEKGNMEREVLGVSVSYNPLDIARNLFSRYISVKSNNLEDYIGQRIEMPCIVIENKAKTYSKGTMLYLELMDDTGSVSAILFDKARLSHGDKLSSGSIVIIIGRVDNNNDKVQVIVDTVRVPEKSELESGGYFTIDVNGKNRGEMEQLRNLLNCYRGDEYTLRFMINSIYKVSSIKINKNENLINSIRSLGFNII
jgi:DNA polymerase-3 subunit alpha